MIFSLSFTKSGGEGEAACGIHANVSFQRGLARAVPSPREERTGRVRERGSVINVADPDMV